MRDALDAGHPGDGAQMREGFIGTAAKLREPKVRGGVAGRTQADQPAQLLRANRLCQVEKVLPAFVDLQPATRVLRSSMFGSGPSRHVAGPVAPRTACDGVWAPTISSARSRPDRSRTRFEPTSRQRWAAAKGSTRPPGSPCPR